MCFHLLYVSTQKNSQRLPCNYIWKCLFYNRQIWNVTFFDEMFHQIEMGGEERPLNSFNPDSALNLKFIVTKKNCIRNDSGDYMTKLRYLTNVNLSHCFHFLSWLTFLVSLDLYDRMGAEDFILNYSHVFYLIRLDPDCNKGQYSKSQVRNHTIL